MPNISIEKAEPHDAQPIVNVFRTARQTRMPYVPELHKPEDVVEYFRNVVLRTNNVLVAKANGSIVGFCAFKDNWIHHLYILPDYQNRGIGSQLLQKAKDVSSDLQLWVFQKNVEARKFYESQGFHLAEETDGLRNEEKEPDARYVWSCQY